MKRMHMPMVVLAVLALAGPAAAAPPPAAVCSVSTTPLSFGVYDVFAAAPTLSTGSVVITCNRNERTTISISASSVSGIFQPRHMRLSSDVMNYNIFTDATLATVWGDGTAGTATVGVNPKANTPLSVPLHGSIPALQNLSAGTYADTLTVTIVW